MDEPVWTTHYENSRGAEQRRRCNEVVLEDHQSRLGSTPDEPGSVRLPPVPGRGPLGGIRVVNTTGVGVEAAEDALRPHLPRGTYPHPAHQRIRRCPHKVLCRPGRGLRLRRTKAAWMPPANVNRERSGGKSNCRHQGGTGSWRAALNDNLAGPAGACGAGRWCPGRGYQVEEEDPQALSCSASSGVVAVLGVASKSPKLFVSRSADLTLDCRPVLKEIMKLVGGGGGGKPEFAQGGGGDPSKLPGALEKAPEMVRAALSRK